MTSNGFDWIWRGTAVPDRYGMPQGFLLMSVGENSGSRPGKTVRMPGEDKKCSARDLEFSTRTEAARRMGANLADEGAGGGSEDRAPS